LILNSNLPDFTINNVVWNSLNIQDKDLIITLENKILLKLPGIDTKPTDSHGILSKFKKWFNIIEDIDFEKITWKKYIDTVLAVNLQNLLPPIQYKSKFAIYIAIMRITVDKIGVSYEEIGIEKSFTDDLGVD